MLSIQRKIIEIVFKGICILGTFFGVCMLFILLLKLISEAIPWIDWQFLSSVPSRFPSKAGIYPLLLGSIYLMLLVVIFSVPFAVCTAIYLEEYAPKNKFTQFLESNISNLAAIPSIVYGLLGLGIFVNIMKFGPGILLIGALTLSLRILPFIIIATKESLKSVPKSFQYAAYGLGASRWETIKTIKLPHALPGILTGIILALANAIGETAPLIMVGVATTSFHAPQGLFNSFGALPLQIFAWIDLPKEEFRHGVTPAAIVILLIILIGMNLSAIIIRKKLKHSHKEL